MDFITNRAQLGTDPYLDGYTPINRARILCAFMDDVRHGEFSKQDSVKGDTAKQALDHVAQTIVASDRPDPRLTQSGTTYLMITRQVRSYTKVDPPPKHQKALPPETYRQILRSANHPRERARAQQLGAAVFFCMRSCEYSKTAKKEQKTRTLRPCDISFRVGGKVVPHDHPHLHLALSVTCLFGEQKTDIKDEPITQGRTNDPELCPVTLWARVIQRLRSYPNYNDHWPVYTYFDGARFSFLSSSEYLADIRIAVDVIGKDVLGFTSDEVGTHSNRSGGAMMMYLAKTPPYTIMMQGRWHSNAFLRYIEKQVLEFSQGVAQKMLLRNTFFNVPLRPWTETDPQQHSRSANNFRSHALREHSPFWPSPR